MYFGKTNVQLICELLYAVCGQTFSLMNFNKNKQRSSLTDGHLEDILKISCSSIESDYAELVARKSVSFHIQLYFWDLSLLLTYC